ncbi:MAG TPA: hypothetical protein VFN61_06795, partial [Acidimicrobiales bacterium]|nr:hypothetical protein [Acidimicrobiales bacterium]
MARQWDKWCTAFALAMAALLAGPAPANAAVVKSVASAPAGGPRVIGWALNGPQVLAAVGNTVFVGNSAGYLTEIDARTGAYIKTIDGHNSAYDLTNPCAMAVSGPYLYVANCPGGEGDMASG